MHFNKASGSGVSTEEFSLSDFWFQDNVHFYKVVIEGGMQKLTGQKKHKVFFLTGSDSLHVAFRFVKMPID